MAARLQTGVLGALCASCFNPTSYDATSEPSVTSDMSAGTTVEASSSTTSTTSTTSAATTTSSGSTEDTSTSCAPCCGDSEVNPPEECDDGNVMDGDGCSSECVKEFRRVFITSAKFSANLGGSEGANQKCQGAAEAASLPGQYRAWLSTSTESPMASFTQSLVPYQRLDGAIVAMNWADLIDNDIVSPINLTELKTFVPGTACNVHNVWTNTNANGQVYNPQNSCTDWTETSSSTIGGNPSESAPAWSHGCSVSCSEQASLYCFEQ